MYSQKISKRILKIVFLILPGLVFNALFFCSSTIAKDNSNLNIVSELSKIRQETSEKTEYVPGEILVKYKDDILNLNTKSGQSKETTFLKNNNLEKEDSIKAQNVSVLKIGDSDSVETKIKELKQDPSVEFAQPNYQYYPTSLSVDDTYRNYQWNLDNWGQTVDGVSGSNGSDIDISGAWNIDTGTNADIIVAVIDNGVAYGHPDLASNMWDGSTCVDYTGGALGNCVHGYDYVGNDKTPLPDNLLDDLEGASHGTHIAGTIAASMNNGTGIAGIAPSAKIMAIKIDFTTEQAVKAIEFAEQNGAKIINASWGGYTSSLSSEDALLYSAIEEYDGLFITSAGNNGYNQDDGVSEHRNYPSGFKLESSLGPGLSNIIAVAASDQNDNLAYFSDYGVNSVDIAAPGVNIYSTSSYNVNLIEDFESTSEGKIPSGWSKGGTNNLWGVREDQGSQGNMLASTLTTPYLNNTSSTVTSPTIDLSNTASGNILFYSSCDTEYYNYIWTDYMTLEISSDGVTFVTLDKWDEASIDTDSYSTGGASQTFLESIPAQYLTNKFKLRFRWTTDSSINTYNGCFIDDLLVYTEGLSAEGYEIMDGTSMAAPQVAGLAALVWGYKPDLTLSEVKAAILDNGDSKSSLSGKLATGMRINAYKTLSAVSTFDHLSISPSGTQTLFTGETLQFLGKAENENNKEIYRDGNSWTGTNSSGLFSATTTGTYQVKVANGEKESGTVNVIVSPAFTAESLYTSPLGGWNVSATKFMVGGDFNGDGNDDMAVMYDYGSSKMGLFSFESGGSQLTKRTIYKSSTGGWNVSATKFMVGGDFNGDGSDDMAVMYDYGGGKMGIFFFIQNGSSISRVTAYKSGTGGWNVSATKFMVSGDFNSDGKDDIAVMYDYGGGKMSIFAFLSNGSQLNKVTMYSGAAGGWNVSATKFLTSGDFDGDGDSDICAMYDYGGGKMSLFTFVANGTQLSKKTMYSGSTGGWNVSATKFVLGGDYNNDGIDDVGAFYDYGGSKIGIFSFQSNGSTFSKRTLYTSVKGAWSASATKFLVSGDFNNDTYQDMGGMYDYGSSKMGLWRW